MKKGEKMPEIQKRKIGLANSKPNYKLRGKKHPAWKGDAVSYSALHHWLARNYGKQQKCDTCGTAEKRMYQWANISGRYRRNRSDWKRVCVPCHRKMDFETQVRGEKQALSKLTSSQVRTMRFLKKKGLKISQLAKKFNISWTSCNNVVTRQTWKHI